VTLAFERPETAGETTHAKGSDDHFEGIGDQKGEDLQEGGTGVRIVVDGGEEPRDRICPPMPDGRHHQCTEQDRVRRPDWRNEQGRKIARDGLGAQKAGESNEQGSYRQPEKWMAL